MHIDHDHIGAHSHDAGCAQDCASCAGFCEHTPMEELVALMKYMVGHNTAHAGQSRKPHRLRAGHGCRVRL